MGNPLGRDSLTIHGSREPSLTIAGSPMDATAGRVDSVASLTFTGGPSRGLPGSLTIEEAPVKKYLEGAQISLSRTGSSKSRQIAGSVDAVSLQAVIEFACRDQGVDSDQIKSFNLGFHSGVLKLTMQDGTKHKLNVKKVIQDAADSSDKTQAFESLHKLQDNASKIRNYEGRIETQIDYIDTKGSFVRMPELAAKNLEILEYVNLDRFTKQNTQFLDNAISEIIPEKSNIHILNKLEKIKRKRDKVKVFITKEKYELEKILKTATPANKKEIEKQLENYSKLEKFFYLNVSDQLANIMDLKIAFALVCQERKQPNFLNANEMKLLTENFAKILLSTKCDGIWQNLKTKWNLMSTGNAFGYKNESMTSQLRDIYVQKTAKQLAAESVSLLFHNQKETVDESIYESYATFMHDVNASTIQQDATDVIYKSCFSDEINFDNILEKLEIKKEDEMVTGLQAALA